jgi:hypothetical protein
MKQFKRENFVKYIMNLWWGERIFNYDILFKKTDVAGIHCEMLY